MAPYAVDLRAGKEDISTNKYRIDPFGSLLNIDELTAASSEQGKEDEDGVIETNHLSGMWRKWMKVLTITCFLVRWDISCWKSSMNCSFKLLSLHVDISKRLLLNVISIGMNS